MTGKELLLVVAVAGVAGAAAGIGSSLANTAAVPDTSAETNERLARIENALARAAEDQKSARESVAKINERVTGLQMDVGTLREAADTAARESGSAADGGTTAGAPDAAVAGKRRARIIRGNSLAGGQPGEGAAFVLGGTGEPVAGTEISFSSPQMTEEIAKSLRAVSEGMRLRMLPEADRWKKAQDEVRLTDMQIENLKRAVAERDAAMKDATQVETVSAEGGNALRIRFPKVDPEKAAAAQQDYDRKVNDTLDADQEKTWKEKGYDQAFGNGGRSSAVFVSTMDVNVGGTPAQK